MTTSSRSNVCYYYNQNFDGLILIELFDTFFNSDKLSED